MPVICLNLQMRSSNVRTLVSHRALLCVRSVASGLPSDAVACTGVMIRYRRDGTPRLDRDVYARLDKMYRSSNIKAADLDARVFEVRTCPSDSYSDMCSSHCPKPKAIALLVVSRVFGSAHWFSPPPSPSLLELRACSLFSASPQDVAMHAFQRKGYFILLGKVD